MSDAVRRWRLDVRYDGGGFSGWAEQTGLRTVQGELQLWLGRVLRLESEPRLVCAGRTDAGVHARGQVAHLDLPTGAVDDGAALQARLARALPDDVAVTRVVAAPAGFDARFGAVWRRYCYRLADPLTTPDPVWRHQVWPVERVIDLAAVNDAAVGLVGLRDFAAFCRHREGATTIRTLLELRAERATSGAYAGVVEVGVRADAFCHSMVRSLVGGLVAVGTGRRTADWLVDAAGSAVREGSIPVLPARGLTLEEVGYPPDDALAARAEAARTRRELPR